MNAAVGIIVAVKRIDSYMTGFSEYVKEWSCFNFVAKGMATLICHLCRKEGRMGLECLLFPTSPILVGYVACN